eukprot:6329316-Pyramimonas_sp.AAC.1
MIYELVIGNSRTTIKRLARLGTDLARRIGPTPFQMDEAHLVDGVRPLVVVETLAWGRCRSQRSPFMSVPPFR